MIYPDSVLVTYIQSPSHPLEIFLYPLTCTPKINTLHTAWQIPFAKCVQLFLQPRRPQHLVQTLFNPKTLLYNAPLWVITNDHITLNLYVIVDKGYYRLTFRNLHFGVGIWWRNRKWEQFSENQNFCKIFGHKTICLNWCLNSKITTLFIAELYS